jgi:hypothetical protein
LKGRGACVDDQICQGWKNWTVRFANQSVRFWQFQSKTEEGAKLEDLKIQGVLKQENELKGIKGPRKKKIKQEAKVTKTGPSGLPNRTIQFF